MQNFKDFLGENYELSEEGYNNLDDREKAIIWREYECYVKTFM